MIYLPAVIY